MPRLVKKPPSYSLHKPSGLAKVKYQGRVTYLGKYGTPASKEAYAKVVANLPKTGEKAPACAEPLPGVMLLIGGDGSPISGARREVLRPRWGADRRACHDPLFCQAADLAAKARGEARPDPWQTE